MHDGYHFCFFCSRDPVDSQIFFTQICEIFIITELVT